MPHKSTKLPWKTRALSVLCQQSAPALRAGCEELPHRLLEHQVSHVQGLRHSRLVVQPPLHRAQREDPGMARLHPTYSRMFAGTPDLRACSCKSSTFCLASSTTFCLSAMRCLYCASSLSQATWLRMRLPASAYMAAARRRHSRCNTSSSRVSRSTWFF